MKTLGLFFFIHLISFSIFATTPAITVQKTGSGDPIIFLPGFTNPGSVFKETIDNLKNPYEYHVITYAGFAGQAPIEFPWYDMVKKELISYVKVQNLQNCIVIGHSMGGNLAVDLAAALPDQISKMILIDSLPCMREVMMPGVPVSQISYDSPYNQQMLNANEEQFSQTATMMAGYMTNASSKIETLKEWMIKADRKTYVYGYTDLLKLDLRDSLSNIKATTLILGASFPSQEMAQSNFEKQYAKLSDKEIVMIPDSKHFIMFDQPAIFYNQVNTFIANE